MTGSALANKAVRTPVINNNCCRYSRIRELCASMNRKLTHRYIGHFFNVFSMFHHYRHYCRSRFLCQCFLLCVSFMFDVRLSFHNKRLLTYLLTYQNDTETRDGFCRGVGVLLCVLFMFITSCLQHNAVFINRECVCHSIINGYLLIYLLTKTIPKHVTVFLSWRRCKTDC